MSRIAPLDSGRHAHLRLRPGLDPGHMRYARLGLSELPLACAEFPICLAKEAETGRFNLIALLSLSEPRNLFWHRGNWQAIYLPSAAASPPFLLDGRSNVGLAVDEESPLVGGDGVALFDPSGHPADILLETKTRFERMSRDVGEAQVMVDRFAALKLIRPLKLHLDREAGPVHEIAGLYALGPQALALLPDDAIVELYRAGYLAAASLMSASLNQLERLRRLHCASSGDPFVGINVQAQED